MGMLNYDSHKRISVDDAVKHPFFGMDTIKDIITLIGSANLDGCGKCRSLQTSLKWGDRIKRL